MKKDAHMKFNDCLGVSTALQQVMNIMNCALNRTPYKHLTGPCYYLHIYMLAIIYCWGEHQTLIITSSSFYERHIVSQSLDASTASIDDVFKCLGISEYVNDTTLAMILSGTILKVIMVVAFNNNHITYHYIDAK